MTETYKFEKVFHAIKCIKMQVFWFNTYFRNPQNISQKIAPTPNITFKQEYFEPPFRNSLLIYRMVLSEYNIQNKI